MRKKLALLLSVVATTTLLFVGCQGKDTTTAEDLVNKAFSKELTSGEVDLTVKMDMTASESGISVTMKVDASGNMKFDDDAIYSTMKLDMEAMGMKISQETKSYQLEKDGKTYEYAYEPESKKWYVSEKDEKDDTSVLDTSKIKDLSLKTTDKEYTVTGTCNASDVGFDMQDMFEELGGVDGDNCKFNFTMTFDKKTKEIKKIIFVLDTKSFSSPGASFEKFEFGINFKKFGGTEVTVPSDVINNAISQ